MARLLLIEDDERFRTMLMAGLTDAGHTVIPLADGRRALTFPDIDLVITDLVMPNCDGLETIDALHRKWPALPIIAMSGVPSASELYLGIASKMGARLALVKPFTPATLLRVIDELLPSRRGPSAAAE